MTSRIQPDAPHPDSYRPDLPLRSELNTADTPELEAAREEGYDEGHDDGVEEGETKAHRQYAARARELETENAMLREKLEKTA